MSKLFNHQGEVYHDGDRVMASSGLRPSIEEVSVHSNEFRYYLMYDDGTQWNFMKRGAELSDGVVILKKVGGSTPVAETKIPEKVETRRKNRDEFIYDVKTYGDDIDVAGFPCMYKVQEDMILVTYKKHLYSTTYFGNPEEFIDNNKETIKAFFMLKTDEDVNDILDGLSLSYMGALSDIDGHILDNTRDMILARVFEMSTKHINTIADKLTDDKLKTKFKKALGLK